MLQKYNLESINWKAKSQVKSLVHSTMRLERDFKKNEEGKQYSLVWEDTASCITIFTVSPELLFFCGIFCFVSFEIDRVSFFSPDRTSLILMAILLHQPPKS